MCSISLRQPSNLVDLLFNFKAFQVVELRLMALEGAVNIVLSTTLWLILALKIIVTIKRSVIEQTLYMFLPLALAEI